MNCAELLRALREGTETSMWVLARELRDTYGMSERELSRSLGVSRTTLRKHIDSTETENNLFRIHKAML